MVSFDFEKLIPPEIWEDLMPVSTVRQHAQAVIQYIDTYNFPKCPKDASTAASGPITSSSGTTTSSGSKKTVEKPPADDFVYPDAIVSQLREELNACKTKLAETQSNLQNKTNDLQQALVDAEEHKSAKQEAEQAKTAAERKEKEEREKAERFEKDLAAARQRIFEQDRKLGSQASDIQNLQGKEKDAVADANRLRGDLNVVKGRMLDSHPRGRIWIAAVYWANLRIDTIYPATLDLLYEVAENKRLFTPSVKFFNNQNPWDGGHTMFLEYRIDETGPMRYLFSREGVGAQFPNF